MSHFTVLVIGQNPEKQLAPFNEQDELYMSFIDKTKSAKKSFETETCSEFFCESNSSWGQEIPKNMYKQLKASSKNEEIEIHVEKNAFSYYKENSKYRGYYTLKNGKRCKGSQWFKVTKILETQHPDKKICFEGKIKIKKINPPKKILLKNKYKTFESFCEKWHGYKSNNGKWGYFSNKNAKWDWYSLGGRWTGNFKLKPKKEGIIGTSGHMTSSAKIGYCDSALKKDIDFEAIRNEKEKEASELYDNVMNVIGNTKPTTPWNEIRENHKDNIEKARKIYNGQKRIKTWIKSSYSKQLSPLLDIDQFNMSKKEYLKNARDEAICTFAVLKDGKWYEKGEMGWWGCVSNEKEQKNWGEEFNKLINGIQDDTLLSIYDCHI